MLCAYNCHTHTYMFHTHTYTVTHIHVHKRTQIQTLQYGGMVLTYGFERLVCIFRVDYFGCIR